MSDQEIEKILKVVKQALGGVDDTETKIEVGNLEQVMNDELMRSSGSYQPKTDQSENLSETKTLQEQMPMLLRELFRGQMILC